MQKTGLHLPEGARAGSARRTTSCAMRIGEDIEPRLRGMLEQPQAARSHAAGRGTGLSPARGSGRRRRIEHDLDARVQLQERRRQPRRQRPVDHALARTPPCPRPWPSARSGARAGSSPCPSTAPRAAPRAGSPPNSDRVRRARLGPQRRRGACAPPVRRRLVEADVTVGADAEDLQVDAAGRLDRALVARALGVGVAAPSRRGSGSAAAGCRGARRGAAP